MEAALAIAVALEACAPVIARAWPMRFEARSADVFAVEVGVDAVIAIDVLDDAVFDGTEGVVVVDDEEGPEALELHHGHGVSAGR